MFSDFQSLQLSNLFKEYAIAFPIFQPFNFRVRPLHTLPGVESFETFPKADPAGRLENI